MPRVRTLISAGKLHREGDAEVVDEADRVESELLLCPALHM
jgi:hypothetical protein